jgi:hypothetical protein
MRASVLSGEINLDLLLKNMSPDLCEGDFVFCVIKDTDYGALAELKPFATVTEPEGLTLVLLKEAADQFGLNYDHTFRCITLNVHSSLEAVGLTAAVSTALSDNQISANIIAGFYHDHIFVQSESAKHALGILSELSQ